MSSKTVRVKIEDADVIEQAAWDLTAELKKKVTVSEIIKEMMLGLEDAKQRIKEKTNGIG